MNPTNFILSLGLSPGMFIHDLSPMLDDSLICILGLRRTKR